MIRLKENDMSLDEFKKDRNLFHQLRQVLTRSERLWLLDCSGDYEIYQRRLRKLAADYKIKSENKFD